MYETKTLEILQSERIATTETIRKHLNIEPTRHAILNTELARLEKSGRIARIGKGVYAYISEGVFGPSIPSRAEIVRTLYIKNGTGYTFGPTFFNQIGLSTWLPRETYIKTIIRATIDCPGYKIKSAPLGCKTPADVPYFQILDCIKQLDKYAVDIADPYTLIRNYIDKVGIDKVKLVVYCNRYYKTTLPVLLKILEGYFL